MGVDRSEFARKGVVVTNVENALRQKMRSAELNVLRIAHEMAVSASEPNPKRFGSLIALLVDGDQRLQALKAETKEAPCQTKIDSAG